jgi:hypothetical protein
MERESDGLLEAEQNHLNRSVALPGRGGSTADVFAGGPQAVDPAETSPAECGPFADLAYATQVEADGAATV